MKLILFLVGFFLIVFPVKADLPSYISWCESQDNDKAINWSDAKFRKDNQPSRGRWQFYWDTWVKFAKVYKIIPENTILAIKEVNEYLHNPIWSSAVAHGIIADGLAEDHWKICTRKYYKLLIKK